MTPLNQISDADLEAEMKRRQQEKKTPPEKVEKPDFTRLINCVEEGLKDAIRTQWMNEDQDHFIVEEVYKAIYGPKFYEWYNKAGIHH